MPTAFHVNDTARRQIPLALKPLVANLEKLAIHDNYLVLLKDCNSEYI